MSLILLKETEMLFLVTITSARGSYAIGHVQKETVSEAQNHVFDILVDSGVPKEDIGRQVTTYSELIIGRNTISITPIPLFDKKEGDILAALIL